MVARIYLDQSFAAGDVITLPPGPSRHVQVLRLQPGDALTLFTGRGGEWAARVVRMGRSAVEVEVGAHDPVDRELPLQVTLALGMPANERMDGLIEKATELGVAAIQPLLCERSVLRLSGERAQKKVEHWRGVAVAASEQSGRTRVPRIAEVESLSTWLRGSALPHTRFMLSLRGGVPWAPDAAGPSALFLSGPEGGLTEAEEAAGRAAGFAPVSLGPRVLRADTAPLAVLAALALAVGSTHGP
ncbi:16S rRNA (uracil(1498)-N(3))-methyltransferase [Piscinibacter sp.]|uniref:16S rRNA (uracil(1498)-N(3))-methyltransferase n=1 Tax=Piscinibacter sp. TaxID=1903157 RepID=UPI002C4CE89D|nr:16S rRNA (uracil(1498)-N(3))-methyltransferase [Albitalea sp.]HUG26598.1 16S rRNA (uracil(1498)-N(3))-methyltransferase [Albitalea sp.]